MFQNNVMQQQCINVNIKSKRKKMTHHAKEITKKPLKVATLAHIQQKTCSPYNM
jgi:hypothetical protein